MTEAPEFGIGNAECGKKGLECGIGTRRRPIGRDYAAAKDVEGGNHECDLRRKAQGSRRKD
jgi:hypothetical protein